MRARAEGRRVDAKIATPFGDKELVCPRGYEKLLTPRCEENTCEYTVS